MAWLLASRGRAPLIALAPSKKVTVPPVTATPPTVTVAVKVTDWP